MTLEVTTRLMIETGKRLVDAVNAREPDAAATHAAKYLELYNAAAVRRRGGLRLPLPLVSGHLTGREAKVVELAARGLTMKLIAIEMGITAGTVKVHLRNARAREEKEDQ